MMFEKLLIFREDIVHVKCSLHTLPQHLPTKTAHPAHPPLIVYD